MTRFTASSIVVVVAAAMVWRAAPVRASSIPPSFTVDLALPPQQRWRGALAAVLAAHPYEHSFGPVFASHNASLFRHLSAAQWATLATSVTAHWPEHAAELRGIAADFAAAGHPEVDFAFLAGWFWFHELAHTSLAAPALRRAQARACTGALVQAPDGTLWHGRNMDQSPPQVRNCTLRVAFLNGTQGRLLFEGVDWYWITTGVMTAVKRGVASLQENWRFRATGAAGPQAPAPMLRAVAAGAVVPQALVFRRALLAPGASYASVVAAVRGAPLASPEYVVAGGPDGAGAVVARDPGTAVANFTVLPAAAGGGGGGGGHAGRPFFLVQTNYDRDVPDPPADDRRTVCERTLRQYGRAGAGSALGVYAAMSTYNVHNPTTAYTAVMCAATGALHAFARVAMVPAADAGGGGGATRCGTPDERN